ncbi:MAG: hypothetical protein COA53_00095 [Rhodobacteraceae bacterium]|nr:MAG: hypothetical protein COA53_00095 [Paracoccaceae bacterium]
MMLEELTAVTTLDLPIRAFAEHLKLGSGFADDGSEDAVLEVCLRSAMAAIEVRIGKALMTRSFSWELTRWGADGVQVLPIAPVAVVNSVTLVDRVGAETVVDAAGYTLERDSHRPKIIGSLPRIPDGGRAILAFDAGFGNWDAVPADLRQAVLLQAAGFYENRAGEGRVNGMPFGVSALIEAYRPIRIGGAW